jgi:threonine/homoserine/homoserine lactone efflux protein
MIAAPSELTAFVKGAGIGLAIAAPVGPIGVLCIRRSLADGRAIGLATGLGAATADAAYGSVAAFGLTAISNALVNSRFWLALIGGIFLCYLGIRTWLSKPADNKETSSNVGGWWSAYASTLLLTLTNPMTILSFLAIFAGLGAGSSYTRSALSLVIGVFVGSAVWWLVLSNGVAFFRRCFSSGWMQVVNRLSGALILGFGVYSLCTLFLASNG